MRLSFAEVDAMLLYMPETGDFYWRIDRTAGVKAGDKAGGLAHGYVGIKLYGCRHEGQRLAWLLTHGDWPKGDVDHVNGNPSDNRILNLRAATRSQNLANSGLRRDNTSGFKGAVWHKRVGKFAARIRVNGRDKHLGYFDTPQEAHRVYVAAAAKHFGEFARSA